MFKQVITYSAIGIGAVIVIGCLNTRNSIRTQVNDLISDTSEFAFFQEGISRARLILGGLPLDVVVDVEKGEEGRTELTIAHDSTEIERERYIVRGSTVMLDQAIGETYEPPIVLLKSPIENEATWNWTGKMSAGELVRPAWATVSVTRERLNTEVGNFNSLRSDVKLLIEASPGQTVDRTLQFWFVEDHGIIQRDFSGVSTRLPARAE
jgi:hypothetical protein